MGPMGNVDTGGNGVQAIWGTWAMRPTGGKWYRGYGAHRQWGNNVQGVWGTGGISHMGNEAHRGYGVQGYGAHGEHV